MEKVGKYHPLNFLYGKRAICAFVAQRVAEHIKYPEGFKLEMIERRLRIEQIKRGERPWPGKSINDQADG